MTAVLDFATDVWNRSIHRIRRADPLLMGAAIAYNSLFALVPLAVAFVAMLTFVDATDDVLSELYALIFDSAIPEELARFLVELMQQSREWVESSREVLILVAVLVALWSGSRAIYAIQKALRMAAGVEEDRGYIRTRGIGIIVTAAACAGVLVAYLAILLGGRFWEAVGSELGVTMANTVKATTVVIAIAFIWLLLWAVYRWGPPVPVARAGLTAAVVAALLVIGSAVAFSLFPDIGGSSIAFLGVIGIFLVWLYYLGIVIVAAPTVLDALLGAVADRRRR